MINHDTYIPNFLICTARGTGKTTSTLKIIEALLYERKWVISIVKQTKDKLTKFIGQLVDTAKRDLGVDLHYNQSKNIMQFGQSLIRGYTLNGDKLSIEKNPPTGLTIDLWAEGILNIFDECAPDLKPELVNVLIQSVKTDFEKPVPKMNLFMCNPWVKSNYYINKWNQALGWNRLQATQPPYFSMKTIDGWCYIGASVFANPMCPETDLKSNMETTKGNKTQQGIVLLGLPGALNGQIFDNFRFMRYEPFGDSYFRFYGGIDIGWTTASGNGGATVLELFKWDVEKGLQGVLEYYHHNKKQFISSSSQQTAILTKLCNYLNQNAREQDMVWINVDVGGDGSLARIFQDEWNTKYASNCKAKVNFFPVTSGMKNSWKLYDRYQWINKALFYSFIQVSSSIQPHLYSDLESAIYKDKDPLIEKSPVMEHEYSDTIIGGLSYAVIGKAKIWLDGWNKRRILKQKQNQVVNTNSTSAMMRETTNQFSE